ncbi:MAG: hypothetical protein WBW88_02210 [Rhodothermales bacterium]
MFVIRDVFKAKPGKAKALVDKFKGAVPFVNSTRVWGARILTDTVAGYWTVVLELEVENLSDYFGMQEDRAADPKWKEAMSGYMDLVEGGYREIFEVQTAWTKAELTVGE